MASTESSKTSTGNLALIGLILAVSMTTIDATIVSLSAPTIQVDLGLSHGGIQWVVNVYLLTTAAFFLLGGRLADVWGHKRMVLIGTAGFALASLLCSLAPDGDLAETWLITARGLQGLAGAVMFPAAIGIVVNAFPKAGRAKAMATFFATTGAMTAVGPIAGGYLTEWTWRSIFWVNIPIAIAAIAILVKAAPYSAPLAERIDWAGAAVVGFGMALIVFGLQQASTWGWDSPAVWGCLVVGAGLLVAFVRMEGKITQPLVRMAAFRDRGFSIAVLATLFSSLAFIPAFYFLSVYGQVSLHLSAISTGLLFLKFFIGFVIAAQLGSRLFDKSGARPVLVIGGAVGAAGFIWLARVVTDLDIDGNAFFNKQTWPMIVAGAGIGYMFSAAATDAVNRAIGATYGEVTAISQSMKNFGGAVGIAVLTTLVTNELTSKVTASFEKLGASAGDAAKAINDINGATSNGSGLSKESPSVQREFLHAVESDYAHAVQWAFYGMGAAMAVVVLLALFYPPRRADPSDAAAQAAPAAL